MKLYIEVLLFLFVFFIFFVWYVWNFISAKRLRKKYTPDNDKSRKGGKVLVESRDTIFAATAPELPSTTIGSCRYEQPREDELLSDGTSEDVGENSDSDGESIKRTGIGKFLGRRNKK